MLYQNYNHLALGHTAFVLGDYKSDIALVGCYNLYIYIYTVAKENTVNIYAMGCTLRL